MRIDENLIAAMPMRFNVYDKLLPTLAHTMWPAGQEFDFAHKEMPRKRGPNGMFKQYRELMWRVRRAAKSGWLSESWLHMEKVMVQSVMTYGKLNDGRPGVLAGPPFKVAIGSLASIGCGSLLRTARINRHKHVFRGSIGSFASLAFAPLQGKVVRVISADFVLVEGAIAASLVSNPFSFSRGAANIAGTQSEYSCDLG